MLSIFLGPDSYTKHRVIQEKVDALRLPLEVLIMPEELPMDQLTSQDLFSGKKAFLVSGAIARLDEKKVEALTLGPHQVFFMDEKIDKRTTFGKSLTLRKDISIQEFPLPHGRQLNEWIQKRVKELGGSMDTKAIEALSVRLGRDSGSETKFGGKVVSVEEIFSLWEAEHEIEKLVSYAAEEGITEEMVMHLVEERGEARVLDIVDAIAQKQKQHAMELLEQFLQNETGSDEKGKIIQLNALLSEQFRNVAMIQDFVKNNVPDDAILSQTSWKSGRLFVIRKIAARFENKKIMDVLAKLSALDEELKTGSTPPRVLLDLIMVQLL